MRRDILMALFDNTTLLLALSVVHQVTNVESSKYRRMQPIFNGILISLICIASMSMPFRFNSGIIFDTRSIIISVTALVFGPISTAITVIVAVIFRVSIGGVGVAAGLATIFTSAVIGLIWRIWIYPKSNKNHWVNIYGMGISVHIALIMCMFLLPYPQNINVFREITMPIMLTYPIVTVLLSVLLIRQQTLRQIQEQLIESERSKTVLLSNLPGLAYRCKYDTQMTMQFVSDFSYNLTGYNSDSLLNNKDLSYNDLIAPEYRSSLWLEWETIIQNKLPFKYEYEIITSTGERKFVLEMGQAIYSETGEVEALEGIVLDISDKKQTEMDLRYISQHDSWTGLYNRAYLEKLLEKDLSEKVGSKRVLISINLSRVQLLTANYGFHYTQKLIKKAADALKEFQTEKCILFQIYEKQFVFYLKEYKDKKDLINFSEDIIKTMEYIFLTDKISGGIGIIEIEKNHNNIDFLLRRLLITSERYINIFEKDFKTCFYDETIEAEVSREGDIRQELSRISEDNTGDELYLQYQPIIDLKTNSICGFEALARLRTNKLGLVSPLEFIPIAEETKLINQIGETIIIRAFNFLNRLKDNGYEELLVSINISAIQLLRANFADRFFELINQMNVNPLNICIEITESIFTLDYENINKSINRFKESGIQIAIDDFGTGYSSLARENELNVNYLKIDKYFMDKLLDTDSDKTITSDIIAIAHKLGHFVIAEGVEYECQLQYLKENNCDKIQGYLISRPLDEEVALEFLKNKEITMIEAK